MIEVNGVRLAYDEAGAGPTVVLSHAGLADRRMWEYQFEQLSADHRVIRYDWRGYGGSDDAAGSFAHYRDLLGLLDALEIDTAALVGCSMGGAYSVDVALAAPERVRALVLICSGLSGHQWPEEMLVQVRARVHSSVSADRLADYRLRRATRVREDDVAAMAEAQARFLVAGPERDPAEVDPAVWQSAVTMLKDVFDRQWRRAGIDRIASRSPGSRPAVRDRGADACDQRSRRRPLDPASFRSSLRGHSGCPAPRPAAHRAPTSAGASRAGHGRIAGVLDDRLTNLGATQRPEIGSSSSVVSFGSRVDGSAFIDRRTAGSGAPARRIEGRDPRGEDGSDRLRAAPEALRR